METALDTLLPGLPGVPLLRKPTVLAIRMVESRGYRVPSVCSGPPASRSSCHDLSLGHPLFDRGWISHGSWFAFTGGRQKLKDIYYLSPSDMWWCDTSLPALPAFFFHYSAAGNNLQASGFCDFPLTSPKPSSASRARKEDHVASIHKIPSS